MNEKDLNENDVIKNAITKHGIKSVENYEDLRALVRYALHVGYNEGYQDFIFDRKRET